MNILLCNDDGIESNGLKILAEKLAAHNNVLVVAPDGNRSATSHSLTLFKPVKIHEYNRLNCCRAYSISGTPADCVKITFHLFKDFIPDIVVAGINKGHNLGSDILYSGTVSAAFEAAFFGKPAFAFSAFSHGESNFELFSDYAVRLIDGLMPLTDGNIVWNINFPDIGVPISEIRFCSLGKYVYNDVYIRNDNGDYELVGSVSEAEDVAEDSDVRLIKKGCITVTPLVYDRTNFKKLREIFEKCIEL